MKKTVRFLTLALALLMLASAFTGCGKKDDKEKLTLATSADFPPYEFSNDDGSFAGIDIEVAQAIADKLGMELVVENMNFDSIIASVKTGKCSMGMAGLTVTDERKESVNFSDSYATGVQAVIVKEDSPITSVDDLGTENTYKIGVQLSTTGDIYVSTAIEEGESTCTVEEYKSGADAVLALVNGQIDCVIIDNEPAKSFVKANSGLKILDTKYAEEEYAICFSKDNDELCEKVNKALGELKEDGTLKKIVDKYIPADK